MTKTIFFYHDMSHILKNKNVHIMVNNPRSPIPQVEEKKKQCTACDVKRAYRARRFQKITDQPRNKVLHAVDSYILKNLPILWENVKMNEHIYGPSVPYFQGKKSITRFSMWNLSWYQIPPRASLINTINSPYAVNSWKSTALASWTSYPKTLCLP